MALAVYTPEELRAWVERWEELKFSHSGLTVELQAVKELNRRMQIHYDEWACFGLKPYLRLTCREALDGLIFTLSAEALAAHLPTEGFITRAVNHALWIDEKANTELSRLIGARIVFYKNEKRWSLLSRKNKMPVYTRLEWKDSQGSELPV